MNHTIRNQFLSATVSSLGGELQSIRTPDGTEYLWQGDAATWADHAPNLFPYIARLTEGKYVYRENTYHMDIHGFLKDSEMLCAEHTEDRLVLTLEDNEATRKQYPFSFRFSIIYELSGNRLNITYLTENTGSETMYFGVGGHPGFNVPFVKNEKFDDYILQFAPDSSPNQLIFTDDCFVTGKDKPLELHPGNTLPLRHSLFDNDALILKDAGSKIQLVSAVSERLIEVEFGDFSYLGLWHFPRAEVDYVCIEPWSSLPSRKEVVEDIEKQEDLISLAAGSSCRKEWCIHIR